jgi:predicted house-cleaning noncanonical NTP pyrophosphatase (MazG superfamily)
MSKTVYNKLIRDRIPEFIHAAGKQYETAVMTEEEYSQALRSKLVEEAQEAQLAAPGDLATELADLQEVMSALMVVYGVSPEQVNALQATRRDERGGFEQRLKLLWSGE